ncbi:MAG: hypothetical protein ACHQ49_06620 [Elusimicrobiota bacterium]
MILPLLLSLAAASSAPAAVIDDSDFSKPAVAQKSALGLEREGRPEAGARVFALETLAPGRVSANAAGAVTGRLMLLDRAGVAQPARLAKVRLVGDGASEGWTPVGDDGSFSLSAPAAGSFKIRVSLDGPRWNFRSDGGEAYEWESAAVAPGADAGTLSPTAGSENAKLGVLQLTYLKAVDFLTREATIDWWRNPLTVVWPGGSDYFSPGEWTLHLTDPMSWDIVTHELGHAVMDGAMNATTGGGAHKIDQCYSEGLAWGEGWASFFAAAVHLSADDADAKFEFMVPRRAPIRIENVPGDVCQGTASEWRVFAGLWDLYDRHDDGLDHIALGFGPIWKGVTSGPTSNILDAYRLIAAGLDPALRPLAEDAMIQNTLLPAHPAAIPALPETPAVSFDGAR